ncbi:hypothetical protein QLT01_14755, partial [Cobetia amphilecti]
PVFKTGAFNRSAIPPTHGMKYYGFFSQGQGLSVNFLVVQMLERSHMPQWLRRLTMSLPCTRQMVASIGLFIVLSLD